MFPGSWEGAPNYSRAAALPAWEARLLIVRLQLWSALPTAVFTTSQGFNPVEPRCYLSYVLFEAGGIQPPIRKKTMSALITPMLGDVYWIGGGSLGLILLIVLIVALVRR